MGHALSQAQHLSGPLPATWVWAEAVAGCSGVGCPPPGGGSAAPDGGTVHGAGDDAVAAEGAAWFGAGAADGGDGGGAGGDCGGTDSQHACPRHARSPLAGF